MRRQARAPPGLAAHPLGRQRRLGHDQRRPRTGHGPGQRQQPHSALSPHRRALGRSDDHPPARRTKRAQPDDLPSWGSTSPPWKRRSGGPTEDASAEPALQTRPRRCSHRAHGAARRPLPHAFAAPAAAVRATALLMVVGAAAELLTIGAALPFLALIAAPEQIVRYPTIARWVDAIGGDPVLAASLLLAPRRSERHSAGRARLVHPPLRRGGRHDLATASSRACCASPTPSTSAARRARSLGHREGPAVVRDLLLPGMLGLTAGAMAAAIFVCSA